jgi:membrane-associated phospholipid phosphatase
MPKDFLKTNIKFSVIKNSLNKQLLFLIIIFLIVTIHLIEVKFIDPVVTRWVDHDYANNIKSIEGDTVYWFSQHWTPGILHFFVIIYIGVYPFTLWFAPLYFLTCDQKKAMKSLAYGLLIIYVVALPFYLFLPITNVYTFYNVNSALETVFPSVENFFYSTTTTNNSLPSLHTAMTILIAYCISLTGNKKLKIFGYFIMISVIISVIYLSIHWLTDVITGIILALGAIFILQRYIKDK